MQTLRADRPHSLERITALECELLLLRAEIRAERERTQARGPALVATPPNMASESATAVLAAVDQASGVNPLALFGPCSNTDERRDARHVALLLLKSHAGLSGSAIARILNLDPSTVNGHHLPAAFRALRQRPAVARLLDRARGVLFAQETQCA